MPPQQTELSESLEDYLECIYALVTTGAVARSRDISRRLDVNTSSVTGALKALSARGLVNYEPYGMVTLTEEGESLAAAIAERHRLLRDFFVDVLQVPAEEADSAACHMEHSGSGEVVRRMGMLMEFIKSRADQDGGKWLREFREFRHDRREG